MSYIKTHQSNQINQIKSNTAEETRTLQPWLCARHRNKTNCNIHKRNVHIHGRAMHKQRS